MTEQITTDQVREIAQATMGEWLDGYQYPMTENGDFQPQVQFREMADGTWCVDPSDGVRAAGELGTYRITVTVERVA